MPVVSLTPKTACDPPEVWFNAHYSSKALPMPRLSTVPRVSSPCRTTSDGDSALARRGASLASGLVLVLLIGFLPVSAPCADATFATLQIGASTLTNATVVVSSPVDLVIQHEGGYLRVKLEELPPRLKEKYPYDAEKAKSYSQAVYDAKVLSAMHANERRLQNSIQQIEVQQEQVRETRRDYRGNKGKVDAGKMKNLQQRIDELDKQKIAIQAQLDLAVRARTAFQAQSLPSASDSHAGEKAKKKKK
jgi:hypothetical protein